MLMYFGKNVKHKIKPRHQKDLKKLSYVIVSFNKDVLYNSFEFFNGLISLQFDKNITVLI